MVADTMHREQVKAALRMRFGTVFEFERLHGLPAKSVSDLLRGRANERVKQAIEKALTEARTQGGESDNSDSTTTKAATHRLNTVAR
jgi:hypothetical protein